MRLRVLIRHWKWKALEVEGKTRPPTGAIEWKSSGWASRVRSLFASRMVGCGNVTLHVIGKHSLTLMENRSTEVALWLCDSLDRKLGLTRPCGDNESSMSLAKKTTPRFPDELLSATAAQHGRSRHARYTERSLCILPIVSRCASGLFRQGDSVLSL